jgi:hypothetical protein
LASPVTTTRAALRAWTWIEPISWSGMTLHLRHTRPLEEVRAWLVAHDPLPYEETAPNRFEDRDTSGQRAHVALHEGVLEFLQCYGSRDEVVGFESALLAELVAGALGPFVWDIVDQDWLAYLASGDDAASLGAYLDPHTDEAEHQARRRALSTPFVIDATAAMDRLALVQAVLGAVAPGHVSSLDDFRARFAGLPTGTLPRSWSLRLPPHLGDDLDWFSGLFFSAQLRLKLSWQTVPADAATTP